MNPLKVKKRDESLEDWSNDKLIASMTKAGVEVVDAQRIALEIKNWVSQNSIDGHVNSDELRDKVIEMLKNDFPLEADSYSIFKKG
ncbi:hypothetical protein A2955_01870 [Candidatus Woesebacteria bacterium RIFCSPLOWO2_01_FULL_37_19]|uniref:ATP-cone domain-containing protein n=2 Tax=Candidatus Woeseibacteriota TaxID=1752722 RepID=A0A1F8AZW8_9BACT|nr:MAG: hypothetical protein A2771_01810 [Candidatus Woesebacteria bacterium RIFCSPHIGHO2_01_FULL_38_26b]OGM56758.1 MAG: hypothetical protein A2955_01870 [Candidatus Woesebacteria bacterium RIFCSPLOWO2_01_FULL_37_19]